MTRAEKASEPSMDEILASIRRIIAEEPAGARPLPSVPRAPSPLGTTIGVAQTGPSSARPLPLDPSTKPAAAPAAPVAQPSSVSPTLPPAPIDRSDAVPRPAAPIDPVAAAMAAAVAPRERTMPRPADPPLPSVAAPAAERTEDARNRDLPFGRIAEALGNERQAALRAADTASTNAANRVEPTLPLGRALENDLSDLLADPPLPPPPAAAAPFAADAKEMPALGEDRMAPRLESSGGRVFARRSIELGQALDAAPDRPTLMPPTAVAPMPSAERLSETEAGEPHSSAAPKLTAQSRVVDKMLSARTAGARPAPPPPEPLPVEPVVIAAMPELAPAAPASLEPPIVEDGLEDLIETDDAQSALGMLAAGLAAAAPVNASVVAIPSPQSPEEFTEPPADDVPTVIAAIPHAPKAVAQPSPQPDAAAVAPPPAQVTTDVVADAAPAAAPAVTAKAPVPSTAQLRPAVSTAAPSLTALAGFISPPVVTVAAPSAQAPAVVSAAPPAERAVIGVRTIEDMVAELLRPMLREWLAENMPRMVEKALRIELAEGLKTVNHLPRKAGDR